MKSVCTFWRDSFKQSCSSLLWLLPLLNLITQSESRGREGRGAEAGASTLGHPCGRSWVPAAAQGSGQELRGMTGTPDSWHGRSLRETKNALLSPQKNHMLHSNLDWKDAVLDLKGNGSVKETGRRAGGSASLTHCHTWSLTLVGAALFQLSTRYFTTWLSKNCQETPL